MWKLNLIPVRSEIIGLSQKFQTVLKNSVQKNSVQKNEKFKKAEHSLGQNLDQLIIIIWEF